MMEPVRSPRNQKVAGAGRLRRARDRRASGLTLVEGPNLLAAAVSAGMEIVEVFALPDDTVSFELAERGGADSIAVTQEVLDRLAPTDNPRGPVATMRVPPATPPVGDLLALAVTDPGNAGTLIRTAAAFGFDVVALSGAVDVWSPKVLRAGAGAHFLTRIGASMPDRTGTIATVVTAGDRVDAFDRLLDPARSWAVLIGPEAQGLSDDDARSADVRVSIPMPGGTESLNAAAAGAIVAYEMRRWRDRVGGPSSD